MIGAVLHLWQRAVDRLGDALEGPEMASLRVTLAALSARVAAAEGEAARLRGELAGLRQTDHDVRTWCEQAADAMDAAYAAGFRYGVDHPGEAFRDARDLGIFLDDQRLRVEWNHGRQDEAAARRLGEDTRAMADAGVQGPSLTDPALVIARLLDERDYAVGWSQGMTEAAAEMETSLVTVTAERDAALDEVERLRGELANAHRACGHALTVEAAATAEAVMGRGAAQAEAENLRCECDELRAKVERLRADAEATAAQSIAERGRLKGRVNEAMDACDQMAKERDEALQWRGVAASVEREVAEDRARLEEAIRERDAAQDTVSDLSYKLDAAGHEWFEAEKERDAARAEVERLTRERDAARGDRDETRRQIDRVANERDDLRRLAREVVKQMGNADGSPLHRCDKKCGRLATWTAPDDIVDLCDDCCGGSFCLGLEDTTHAAAWRALVAALPTETP